MIKLHVHTAGYSGVQVAVALTAEEAEAQFDEDAREFEPTDEAPYAMTICVAKENAGNAVRGLLHAYSPDHADQVWAGLTARQAM